MALGRPRRSEPARSSSGADGTVPVDPPPSPWLLPDPADAREGQELVAAGGDLAAGTLLAGYRKGMFAMPEGQLVGWWSPDPRGVLHPADVHVSRSLRRVLPRFEVSVDREFRSVLAACSDPRRPHGWISPDYRESYEQLHALGWAHSLEVWDESGRLVGGLFGVESGGLFAAESKFHVSTGASKVAVVALADLLARDGDQRRLIDVQWSTAHLASLGVVQMPRERYLAALPATLSCRPLLGGQPWPVGVAAPRSRIRWRSA